MKNNKLIKKLNKLMSKLEKEYMISVYSLREDLELKSQIEALKESIKILRNMEVKLI